MALPPTETRLEASLGLDDMTTLERLTLMNEQDRIAVEAVGAVLPQLAELVEVAAGAVRAGGSIHYFGAGTSGRLGVLDAAELLPTYNLPDDIVVGHIAGGERALVHAVENSEDSVVDGARAAADLRPNDVAIGLAASGNTPYVGAALEAARAQGAATALISCNPHAALAPLADIEIVLRTGAEVVTGSTRLKAGSAQKMALNGFSTALMIALGRTWSNLMVSVVATNDKLRDRSIRIFREATGTEDAAARASLAAADGDLRVAIVAQVGGIDAGHARGVLESTGFSVRDALHRVQE